MIIKTERRTKQMKNMSGLTRITCNSSLSSIVLSPASNFDWPNDDEELENDDAQNELETDEDEE